MSDWAGIAWLVVQLAFNAFFVGAEFAVISARRSQIEPLAEKGSRAAKTALYAMEHATLMLATSQLGITICSLLILATPLVWMSKVFHPIIVSLNWIANHVVRLFRVEPKDEAASTFTLEEVATIVNQSRIEGVLNETAGTVRAAVEFTDKKAKDVAVPLAELVTLPETATPDKIERAVAKHGFSRYVIVDGGGS